MCALLRLRIGRISLEDDDDPQGEELDALGWLRGEGFSERLPLTHTPMTFPAMRQLCGAAASSERQRRRQVLQLSSTCGCP